MQNVACDYMLPYAKCMKDIYRKITESIDEDKDRICIMGAELGGFYALQFRHPSLIQAVAWNPLVYPALQLGSNLADNKNFQEILLSYTQVADPRVWNNAEWQEIVKQRRSAGLTSERAFYTDLPDPAVNRCVIFDDRYGRETALLAQAFGKGYRNVSEPVTGEKLLSHETAGVLMSDKITVDFSTWNRSAIWDNAMAKMGRYELAGIFRIKQDQLIKAERFIRLPNLPYCILKNDKNKDLLIMVFFYSRQERIMHNLLAGIVRILDETQTFYTVSAGGRIASYRVHADYFLDTETPFVQGIADFDELLKKYVVPTWKITGIEVISNTLAGSYNGAFVRSAFTKMLETCEDPVAEFLKGIRYDASLEDMNEIV